MEINVSELNEKIAYLSYGISKSTNQMAYADCVILDGEYAYTFSGSTRTQTKMNLGFVGAVNYEELYKYIRTVCTNEPETMIDFSIETGACMIKRGRSVTRLPYTTTLPFTLEELGQPDPNGWKYLPPAFKQAIKKCESIFSRQIVTNAILSCIHITPDYVEAATPDQVIRVKCPMDLPFQFLVKFGRLGKLFGTKYPDPVEYQVTDKWLFFRTFDTVFGIPVSRDSFVDISRFFVAGGEEVSFPDAASMDIPFFQSFHASGSDGIRMEFHGDYCSLSIKTRRGQHALDFPMACPDGEVYKITPSLLRALADYGKCSFTGSSVYVKTDAIDYVASVTKEGPYGI